MAGTMTFAMRAVLALVVVWASVVDAHAAEPASGVQARDDRGLTVVLPRMPLRVVSLLPSLTETVCALGACDRLVGVDRDSNYPAQVRALPLLGGGLDPSVEAVVALRPDLVLVAGSTRVADRLHALGLAVAVFEPKTHADVRRVLEQVGQLLGVDTAGAVWERVVSELDAARQSVPERARGQRVYFEVDNAPYAASDASFIGETLLRLGMRNIVPGNLGPFPKLNPEFVVRADPQVILLGEGSHATLTQRAGWSRVSAVRNGRICAFSRADADMLVRAGPRLGLAAERMAQCFALAP